MYYPAVITPVAGSVYKNRNGETYKCIRVIDELHSVMERVTDGYTLTAHSVRIYDDGTITWDMSTRRHWPSKT